VLNNLKTAAKSNRTAPENNICISYGNNARLAAMNKKSLIAGFALTAGLAAAAPALAENTTVTACTHEGMTVSLAIVVKDGLKDRNYFVDLLKKALNDTEEKVLTKSGWLDVVSGKFIKAQEKDGRIMEPGGINLGNPPRPILGGPACKP
jgi:hypothetical protein